MQRAASALSRVPREVGCLLGALVWVLSFTLGTVQAAGEAAFRVDDQLLELVELKYGEGAGKRLRALSGLIEQHAGDSEQEQVEYVNGFFNQIPYYTDLEHWLVEDYWATPVEKLATNGGDCEDYSIAKYFALRELGLPDDQLRLMYVKLINWGQAHMVLTYFPDAAAMPLVLDNFNPEVLPADQRTDLVPVYSFNGDGLWLAKSRGTGKRVGGSEKVGLWTDLLQRLEDNQF